MSSPGSQTLNTHLLSPPSSPCPPPLRSRSHSRASRSPSRDSRSPSRSPSRSRSPSPRRTSAQNGVAAPPAEGGSAPPARDGTPDGGAAAAPAAAGRAAAAAAAAPQARPPGAKPPPSAEAVKKELLRLRRQEKELGGRVRSLQGGWGLCRKCLRQPGLVRWHRAIQSRASWASWTIPFHITTTPPKKSVIPLAPCAEEVERRDRQLGEARKELEELHPQLERYKAWVAGEAGALSRGKRGRGEACWERGLRGREPCSLSTVQPSHLSSSSEGHLHEAALLDPAAPCHNGTLPCLSRHSRFPPHPPCPTCPSHLLLPAALLDSTGRLASSRRAFEAAEGDVKRREESLARLHHSILAEAAAEG